MTECYRCGKKKSDRKMLLHLWDGLDTVFRICHECLQIQASMRLQYLSWWIRVTHPVSNRCGYCGFPAIGDICCDDNGMEYQAQIEMEYRERQADYERWVYEQYRD